ncbi:cell wall-binding repeat-containing protein [Clostridium thermarum]|uniref:cell wall-binding repeat-containing protein n=1 Tax=Clostridium thermarum TaxID=1716543 RepID=UPI0011236ABB|nr:cell wall-binding repeat-containing protein [Clostridium thermarum]
MKQRKSKSLISMVVAFAMSLTTVPASIVQASSQDTDATVIYSNDFEDSSKLPSGFNAAENVNGSKALDVDVAADPSSQWDELAEIKLVLSPKYSQAINLGAKLKMDLLLPEEATFDGGFKVAGVLQTAGWDWNQNDVGPIAVSDFTKVEGYNLATVEVPFKTINNNTELNQITIKIVGYECNYKGKVYLDNVSLIDGTSDPSTGGEEVIFINDFEDASNLPFNKDENDLVDVVTGKAVRYAVEFSPDNGWDQTSWDKENIEMPADVAGPVESDTVLKADLILPKTASFSGTITVKGVVKVGDKWSWTEVGSLVQVKLDDFTESGDYLVKTFEFIFSNQISNIKSIVFQVVGNNSDYKGDIYLDNVKLTMVIGATDKYVTKIEVPVAQTKLDPSKLNIPDSVKLVDEKAIDEIASLYAYLLGVGASDYVIYGHQNDTHHKAVLKDGGSNSDTKDVTGSIAGIVAIDTLSLTGAELHLEDGDDRDFVTAAADLLAAAAEEGAIISLSAHMPNFEIVKNKGKQADGTWDFSGYTPGVTNGNIVTRIMPEGDLNEVFLAYLDLIADLGNQLEEKGIPVLFRPFHENSGSWFWWGAAHCDQAAFKNLWRYTVEYLRDVKDVHNFLYVYSPNGPIPTEEYYLERYPGDDYVDVMAFDYYNNDPDVNDSFIENLKDIITVVEGLAKKHNKLTAVSETGMIPFKVTDNKVPDWFSKVLEVCSTTNMAYYLTWANFDESNMFQPYMVDETRGHEMVDEFVKFYNDERSVFADGIGDYSSIRVTKLPADVTGFITAPHSGYRLLEATTIKASVLNTDKAVNFVLKDGKGNELKVLEAVGNGIVYTSDLTKDILTNIEPNYGSIELVIDGKVYDKIRVFFNLPEEPVNPAVVDTFESYYGNDEMIAIKWATNAAAGCSVKPMNTDKAGTYNNGDYGLAFKYKISTEKSSEGWAGITKSLPVGTDWSEFDAYQLWIKPDGNAQKLVIQITSNGEDFEVHLPEFAATTEAKLLTIPFSQFKGKKNGTFDPANVSQVGLWCNTIIPEGHTGTWTVDSVIYYDDIKAVKKAEIVGIDNITATVIEGQAYSLPSKVYANLDDGSSQILNITWDDETVDTSKAGTFTFNGTVDGYDKKITLTLVVTSKTGPSTPETSTAEPSIPESATVVNTNAQAVIAAINGVTSNGTVIVDVADNKLVEKVIFDKIKGTDKTVTFKQGGIEWSFKGKDITGDTKNIDMTVKIAPINRAETANKSAISDIVKNKNVLVLSFTNNGQLPGKAKIRVKLDSTWISDKDRNNLCLYYYNEATKTMESIATGLKADSDGYVEFEITHNSDYIITDKMLTAEATIVRLGGANRYETAVKISQAGWKTAESAVLARGDVFADALCAIPFAKQLNAPILLTIPKSLDNSVKSELQRLKVKKVYIIGGTGAVSTEVENILNVMGISVERIGGADRYSTSLKIANRLTKKSQVFLCSGTSFADAFSISSYVALSGSPILFAGIDKLPDEAAKFIKDNNSKVYVIGGTGVVSDSVVKGITGLERVSGADRYETNLAILNKFAGDLDFSKVYYATGKVFADALSGSVLAALTGAPVVLVDNVIPEATREYLKSKDSIIREKYILGGESVIPTEIIK